MLSCSTRCLLIAICTIIPLERAAGGRKPTRGLERHVS